MLVFIAFACLAGALVLLIALSVIDLKERLLPDVLTLPLMALGLIFHLSTTFQYASIPDIAAGILMGAGLLYAVRVAANAYYKDDTLGLGDVKLMGAAGAWLGSSDILIAIIAGALAGILHGLVAALLESAKTKKPVNLKTFSLPAGPGFAVGIIIAGIFKFHSLFDLFI